MGRDEVSTSWNSDYFKLIRKTMLAGQEPPNCTKCYYRESHGGTSRRQKENDAWSKDFSEDLARKLTKEDGSIDIPPVSLDIRTGNVCNLKCVTCFPTNSTKWLEDTELLGKYENTQNYKVVPAWDQADGPAWKFVKEHGPSLKKISFLGGEPLASPLHQSILESLISQSAYQVALKYVTNGTLLSPQILGKWARFDSVQIMVSIDGIGPILEFIRFPAKWAKLELNLKLLNDFVARNVKREVLWTCSNLSLYYLPETLEYFGSHFPGLEFVLGDYVTKPAHMSAQNLPPICKELILDKFRDKGTLGKYPQAEFYLNNMMEENLWPSMGSTLIQYLDDLDRARKTNWRDSFKELSPYLK